MIFVHFYKFYLHYFKALTKNLMFAFKFLFCGKNKSVLIAE